MSQPACPQRRRGPQRARGRQRATNSIIMSALRKVTQSKKRLLNIWVRQITPQERRSPISLHTQADKEATYLYLGMYLVINIWLVMFE